MPTRASGSYPARLVFVACGLVGGCLPAFAPVVATKDVHTGLHRTSPSQACMDCHVAEGAVHREADAPIVAAWMIEDRRGCAGCHWIREVH